MPGIGRPFGTNSLTVPAPNAEALGYFQSSLRDEELQILVALDGDVRAMQDKKQQKLADRDVQCHQD